MKPLLSILIPTVVGREEELKRLTMKIKLQIGGAFTEVGISDGECLFGYAESKNLPIWIQTCKDDKAITIGDKRNRMYQDSCGLYSWQIDDDDDISDDAIRLILEAISQNPDCITFQEDCLINGQSFTSNHSIKYSDWGEKQDGFDYVRTPFMKDVIRTEIAKSVPVPFCRFGEDHLWSQALKPHLKNEIHIDQNIYLYRHESTNHTERYGFDKD